MFFTSTGKKGDPRHFPTVRLDVVNKHKHKQNESDNLTRMERKALNELINNPTLVINKADKGSTIVIQDRSDYITEAMKHLTHTNYLTKTTNKLKESTISWRPDMKMASF